MTLNEQRDRLLRILAGALLTHSADPAELNLYCSILATDHKIGADIADLLIPIIEPRNASRHLKPVAPKRQPAPTSAPMEVLETLQRLAISKSQCLEAMKKANPRFIVPPGIAKMAVKDLVRRFVAASSLEQVSRLISYISPDEIDPYLRGMGKSR